MFLVSHYELTLACFIQMRHELSHVSVIEVYVLFIVKMTLLTLL